MKLNYKRTILIGFAFMSILSFWQFYDQVVPYLLKFRFQFDDFTTNAIMSVDNVLAIFMLPLFGAISDRTKSRLGKRTPYILYGTVAAVILTVILGVFSDQGHSLGFIITLMALLVAMAMYRTPAVAYMPDVTEKPLRSKGNAVINLMGYVGGIFSMIVMMFLLKATEVDEEGLKVYSKDQKFLPVFIIVAAFMLITALVTVVTLRENRLPHVTDGEDTLANKGKKMDKGVFRSLVLILLSVFFWFMAYNAVTTAFSRYCVEVWGADISVSSSYLLVATIAAIALFMPLGMLSSKLGRKRMVLLGIALMTLCYGIAIFITRQTPVMYLIFALVGIGWAAINVNSFPMVVEMSKGSDVGKYTGFYYTFSMAAQIATPLLSAFFISNLNLGYASLFPYAVIFSALSFVTMSLVRHGDVQK